MKQKSLPILKLIGYFILGMFTFYVSIGFYISLPLGLIIGLIWLKFKTKEFRKEKLIALILGFTLVFVIPFVIRTTSLNKPASNFMMSKIPGIDSINKAVTGEYPEVVITSVNIKNYISGDNTTIAEISLDSKQTMSEETMVGIARITCDELDKQFENDNIKKVALHYRNNGFTDTCENWRK